MLQMKKIDIEKIKRVHDGERFYDTRRQQKNIIGQRRT